MRHVRVQVAVLWTLDLSHTIMICIANWIYLIRHFGDRAEADHITWSIAVTITLTAVVTFLVQCFFTHRIYVVSRGKKIIAIPLIVLALFRLAAALVSTGEMIRTGSFSEFVRRFEWVFTMGLSSAVALDAAVTIGLSYFLRKSKTGFKRHVACSYFISTYADVFSFSMNDIIDVLILYTVETGIITCAVTIATLICWVTMPHDLIFLGLHFTIIYANVFLATLNSRATLRARSMSGSRSNPEPPSLPPLWNDNPRRSSLGLRKNASPVSSVLQISVEKTVRREVEDPAATLSLPTVNEEAVPTDDRSSYMQASSSRSHGSYA
ncbi:hypothetical protein NM688_g2205 [Phlebia brevispora]|uniref:Uncharacterized protein n=1 Tax=Phlebia brevispora TaxID=194682 RepID=A0ACC1T9M4_9APHY|nr:hypothetical protein NM688_g2205 [Phlebia brevispora]